MARAVFRRLPLVAGAHDAPALGVPLAVVGERLFGLQFLGREFAAQADVVKHPQRLIDAFRPMRHNLFDDGPGAHRLHVHTLILVKMRFHPIRLCLTGSKR